ncbi:MAG: amino acid adenylation domain-containing protein [Sulfitobacter sp.]|nr:amino acid adenylation domain-containing protein [Sulfitobacter sp.]
MSETAFALTPMQMGMLFESVGTERPWVNVEQVVVEFDAQGLDDAALDAAWRAVQDRYEALRLIIDWRGGAEPRQWVGPKAVQAPAIEQWDARDEARATLIAEDRETGFAMTGDMPWRLRVMRDGQGQGTLLFTVHHAVLDGRSMARVVADLFHHIDTGAVPDKPDGPGFAAFCRAFAKGEFRKESAEAHFSDVLADFEGAGDLDLPAEGPLAPAGARMGQCLGHLDRDETSGLRKVAIACDATLANAVQGAWSALLSRWQGRGDVAFGTVRSGRHAMVGLGQEPGCFINTLPLRLRIDPSLTLGTLLSRLRQETLALHEIEQTDPADLRRWGAVPGRQALFNSIVMFEKADLEALVRQNHDSPRLRRVTLLEEGGQPLTLAVYDGDCLRLMLEHDPARVSAAQANRLLDHLLHLLRAFAGAGPHVPLGALDMLPPAERDTLLNLSQPDQPLPDPGTCLARRFAEVVARTPGAQALVSANGTPPLSYAALDARANGIALALVEMGIGAGDIVAVGLGRGPDFIASLLAVLKTGAAFLPCDPAYPQPVKQHMIRDSGAAALISEDARFVTDAPPMLRPDAAPRPDGPPLPEEDPEALAYVIYTSGSTGIPKGVQASRSNLLSHIAATRALYALGSEDRVLQFASLSFDVALEEIFPTLMAGATLVLRSDEMAQSTGHFLEEGARLGLTVTNLPAMFWEVLTNDMKARKLAPPDSLRLMITGSERVNPASLADWRALAPGVAWMNGYGPTETTITATLYEATEDLPKGEVPIGRPVPHARAHLLAPDRSLAPMGALGELAIGGPAVTQGYIGRSDANAETFLPGLPGLDGRIYLTGDRARWRADRALDFFGRNDRQVKVRGYRIDLRQIERAIEEEWPSLRAVASVLERGTPSARLVAWVTGDPQIAVEDMRRRLRDLLPAHMQPVLMQVAEFPETAGGKTDIKALPVPDLEEETDQQETGDALETEVCQLMAEVLGRRRVGLEQNFFDLGGHSLLSVELIGKLEARTGTRIGLADFQAKASPRALASLLRGGSGGPHHIIPIQPKGTRPPLLGIHILGANEEYFRPLAAHLGPDQPVMGVSVGSLGPDTPTGVVETAQRYCNDINRTYPEGPLNLMAVSLGSYMAFELTRQLLESGRDIGLLVLFDASGPMGRPRKEGLAKWRAHLRRAWDLGPTFPIRLIRNQAFELMNRRAARRMASLAEEEGTVAPSTVFEFIASNERAVAEYDPAPLAFPITILRAASNVYDTTEGIAQGLGWGPVAAEGFRIIEVPGGHLSMLKEPHVARVAQVISDLLDLQKGAKTPAAQTKPVAFRSSQAL